MAAIAGNGLRPGLVHRYDLGFIARRRQDRPGVDHAGDLRVDAEHGRAIGLGGDVAGLELAADQPPLRGRLDGQGGQLLVREAGAQAALRDDVAVADRTLAGQDRTLAGDAGRGRDAEDLRAGLDEGDPPGGAGLAQEGIALPDRPGPAGDHQAPLGVGVDVDDADLVPVRLELIGDDAGQGRPDVLAHLGPDDVDGHDPLGVDGVPEAGLEGRRPGIGPEGHRSLGGGGEAEGRARGPGGDQEPAAAGVGEQGAVHERTSALRAGPPRAPLRAASFTALRIRT